MELINDIICVYKMELYYKTCSDMSRYHNRGSMKHMCFESFIDTYLHKCAKKQVDQISGAIKYIPNKPEYDPHYDIDNIIIEYYKNNPKPVFRLTEKELAEMRKTKEELLRSKDN